MNQERSKLELERDALRIVEAVLEQDPDSRAEALETRCADDPLLHSRVTTLLGHETAGELVQPGGMLNLADIVPEMCEEVVPGGRVGSYELVRPIARGGMGWVYEALQDTPHRRVALKILRRGFESDVARGRFQLESEVLAFLKHPGIAQVYEAGVHVEQGVLGDNPMPYLALEFVEGARPITGFAKEQGLDARSKVELFLEVCDAVHYGHLKGVIHRDLKPANILVGSNGKVKVIDFGIARVVKAGEDSSMGFTRTGQVLGTLGSMSPEQFGSDPKEVDVRSDVYSLGVVLFQLLSGRRPFDLEGKSVAEVAAVVRAGHPITPRSLVPDLPLDLEAVVLKAIQCERDLRYVSVLTLMEDLQRFLSREPVQARAPGLLQRARLFTRRNPLPVGLVAALIAVLSVSTGVLVNRVAVTERALDRAERATAKAELATLEAESSNRAMLVALKQAEDASAAELAALVNAEAAAQAERAALEQERLSKVDLLAFEDTVILNTNRRLAGWGVDLRNSTDVLPIENLGEEGQEPGSPGSVEAIAADLLGYPEGSSAHISGRYLTALIETRNAQASLASGSLDLARSQYEEAQGSFAALYASYPTDVRYAMGLADVTVSIGSCIEDIEGERDFLTQCLRDGLSIAEGLGEYSSTDLDCVNFIVFNYSQLGVLSGLGEEQEPAVEFLTRSLNLGLACVAAHPESQDARSVLAYNQMILASVYELQEEYALANEQALAAYELLLELVDELDDPDSTFVDMVLVNARRGSVNLGWSDALREAGEEWGPHMIQAEESFAEAALLIEDRLGFDADDQLMLEMQDFVSEGLMIVFARMRNL